MKNNYRKYFKSYNFDALRENKMPFIRLNRMVAENKLILVESQLNFLEITINGFEPKNNCC